MKNIMKQMYVSRDSSRFIKIALNVAGGFFGFFFLIYLMILIFLLVFNQEQKAVGGGWH